MNLAANVVNFPGTDDVELILLDPDDYDVIYQAHKGVSVFRGAKVRIDFQLMAHPDLILPRWYRVQDHRGGRIRAGRHSDIVRELSAALGRRIRHDRIPVGDLAGKVLRARVDTVKTDSRQQPLAQVNYYSVVTKLLATISGAR